MNTKVNIAGIELKNPVMTASGTFGSGMEYAEFADLNRLGAVVTKGVANVPWEGNPTPRVTEVYGGMLNAIGLQNPGVDVFMERDLPFLSKYDTRVIVNVCGHTVEEYTETVRLLLKMAGDLVENKENYPAPILIWVAKSNKAAMDGITKIRKIKELQNLTLCYVLDYCTKEGNPLDEMITAEEKSEGVELFKVSVI